MVQKYCRLDWHVFCFKEQETLLKMKEQQLEYECRIRQLRIDLGALKDAYLKLEKHHGAKPDKFKRILHDKNKQINTLQQENLHFKSSTADQDRDKDQLKGQIQKVQSKWDEEKLKNIILQRDISKLCKNYSS